MKNVLLLVGCLILAWQTLAWNDKDKMTDESKQHIAQQKQLLAQFKTDNALAYQSFRNQFRLGLQAYKGQLIDVWGYAEVSTNSKWVHYSDDMSQKLVVDYQRNTIALQRQKTEENAAVSVTDDDIAAIQFVEQALMQKVGDHSIAESLGFKIAEVSELALQLVNNNDVSNAEFIRANIQDLIQTKTKLQSQATRLDIAEQRVERQYIEQIDKEIMAGEQLLAQDNLSQTTLGAKVSFANKRVDKALLYRSEVSKQATYYGLPESLIYAVMEVESSFNPKAQSPVPAFGLMQIVPSTAGKDVNRYLNKGDIAPSSADLFQPPKNVMFGTTYLSMLYRDYFKDIKDPQSRQYCVIAAYNTGMGNVAAIFSRDGSKSLFKAAKVINKLTPKQVHDKIKSRAHSETKRYITKILASQQYFEQALN